jgi:uncharacterized protein YbjT (DUF2867 family)
MKIRAKVVQEKLIEISGIPHTIIRSTRFLEFLGTIAGASTEESVKPWATRARS